MESLIEGSPWAGEGADDAGFEAFWREWRPRAAAYARAFGGLSAEDREELAAEAVTRAWLAEGRRDRNRPFAPWFFAIVRHLALDTLRRRRELSASPENFDRSASHHEGPEGGALRKEEAEFVRRFVAALPERDRELSCLIYGAGLGIGEAARIAGMPTGTAKWRLYEVRKALRKAWEREYGG